MISLGRPWLAASPEGVLNDPSYTTFGTSGDSMKSDLDGGLDEISILFRSQPG